MSDNNIDALTEAIETVIKDEIIKSNNENQKSNNLIIEKLTELNK